MYQDQWGNGVGPRRGQVSRTSITLTEDGKTRGCYPGELEAMGRQGAWI